MVFETKIKDLKELKDDVNGYDLEVVYDYRDARGKEGIYYIRTFEDRSVGIFGYDLSPTFEEPNDLIYWWETVKEIFPQDGDGGERVRG